MRNVMWKGELAGTVRLDTLPERSTLYGIGPVSGLRGEIMMNGGAGYVSRVTSDSTMTVEKTYAVAAPFLVTANVSSWDTLPIPTSVTSLVLLENYVDAQTDDRKRPFAFRLVGAVDRAIIHVQNLAVGAKVSSPQEAHAGQVKYTLGPQEVEILGFFSTEHAGVFTHHDTYQHLHLVTADERWMGHVDEVSLNPATMRLLLPAL